MFQTIFKPSIDCLIGPQQQTKEYVVMQPCKPASDAIKCNVAMPPINCCFAYPNLKQSKEELKGKRSRCLAFHFVFEKFYLT